VLQAIHLSQSVLSKLVLLHEIFKQNIMQDKSQHKTCSCLKKHNDDHGSSRNSSVANNTFRLHNSDIFSWSSDKIPVDDIIIMTHGELS